VVLLQPESAAQIGTPEPLGQRIQRRISEVSGKTV
jgi:hypothetical protein